MVGYMLGIPMVDHKHASGVPENLPLYISLNLLDFKFGKADYVREVHGGPCVKFTAGH